MDNKLNELDSMILEALQEKINPDLFDIDKDGKVKWDNKPLGHHPSNYAKKLANLATPPQDQFNEKDIKKLLLMLKEKTASALASGGFSKSALRWSMERASEAVAAGHQSDKEKWHVALHILTKRYGLSQKIGVEDPLSMYSTLGNVDRKTFAKVARSAQNWLKFALDLDPAASTDTIASRELPVQDDHSLLKIDMRNASSEASISAFPSQVANAINVAFSGTSNLYQRLQAITDHSNALFEMLKEPNDTELFSNISAMELQQLMARMVLLDYFTSIVSDMDDGSGAYLFESFLAAMAGGKVEGKATTGQGKMAATDFSFHGGVAGSAKYYTNFSGIHQAVGGFKPGVPMHYVVGIKNKENVHGEVAVKSVDIYYYKIILKKAGQQPKVKDKEGNKIEKLTNVWAYAFDPEGDPLSEPWKVSGDLHLGHSFLYSASTKVGRVNIIGAGEALGQKFKDKILEATKKVNKDFGEVVATLGNVATSATKVKDDATLYTMKGKQAAGDKAVASLNDLNTFFANLYDKLTDMGYESSTTQKQYTKENQKKSLKELDKLIEQVILYKNTEEK